MRKRNEKGQFVKSKVSEFGFVNLSTYTSPEIKEVNGEDWIEYGADNNYFQYLIDRYNGSPTNNAAINGISQAIYGKGLNATDSNRKPNEYAQMVSLFRKDVVRKLCYDLKLMGQCAIQIIYSKDRSKIVQLEHMPIETLRAEKCNEDGDVPAYYYFNDWANIKRTDDPLRIPAFGMSNENIEILYIKPYKSGFYYYSPVDYQGGLQYAELEEEVSNYHLNNIMNGLSPSMLINFNNGTPNQQERQLIETKIAQKFSGTSNAGKFILAFNDNKESQAEITPVQLSDAHNQYQFLSEESTQKIMVAHRIVSPMLLGIKDGSGLGNNAEEIKTASLLMDNTVIRPFQELLIDSFDQILAYNEISLNLYFTTLQPLEFTEVDTDIQDEQTIEEETGVEMSSDKNELTDEMADAILENLKYETIGDDYELVETREYSEDNTNTEDWANSLIKRKLSRIRKFADFITSKPNEESKLDKSFYKIRYTYQERKSSANSRDFCKTMMARTGKGVVYRKEDIDNASFSGVNNDFGHKGQNYSLFRFKGGIYCGHYWQEELYRMKSETEKYISKGKEVKSIPNSYQPKGKQYKEAGIAPTDMKNRGAYPN
jgi:glycerophosphoryl diester phosphodiesterase